MEKDTPEHQHAPPPCVFVERTLALIKPDAVDKADEIEDIILLSGFTILQKRKLQLSPEQCSDFYAEHYGQPFFPSLTAFMSSGPVVALALARHRAIATWKDLMGPSNSTKARETHPDCLRARFGTSDLRNAVHGSETFSAAERELKFMFPNSNHAEGAIMQKIMQIQVKSLFTKCDLSDFDRGMVAVVAVIEPIPKGEAATDYLSRYINPTLLIGLTELCKTKPADPFTWLADWLIQNNPNKPQIIEGIVVEDAA